MMIYFIQCTGSKRVKIGCTGTPHGRMELLATNNAFPVELLAVIEGDRYLERAYHDDLLKYRRHSEWFEGSEEVMARIEDARNGIVLQPSHRQTGNALNWKKLQEAFA